jgi:5-methylcytosine-specific restriction endonuclease McrA
LRKKIARANNPEKFRAANKKYAEQNPNQIKAKVHRRRARLASASIYLVRQSDLQKIGEQLCIYCGADGQTIEHIIPLSRGGTHSIGNLAAACGPCNFSKAGKTIMEWRIWKLRLGL